MSINHFCSDLPSTFLWTQQPHHRMPMSENPNSHSHQHQPWLSPHNSHLSNTPSNFNLNNTNENDDDDEEIVDDQTALANDGNDESTTHNEAEEGEFSDKEPMFEKALTPSDVGKLNRLVIPKQHAEKYFPLGGGSDSGLLLSFEDELGKCWRFRYSYWNSSQSYVLTKGWSRYVKEKRLDAGDVVFFQRHRVDAERLFIGWRRRLNGGGGAAQDSCGGMLVQESDGNNGSGGWTRMFYSAQSYPVHNRNHHHQQHHHHHHNHHHQNTPPVPYQPDCLHAGIFLFTL